jgi:mannose-1-phosphate guanylyltransferase/mannose-6-phosphate isomerase
MAARQPAPTVAVLAGGSGTRFWPAGRRERPKQVLALDGDEPRSLLELTLARLLPLAPGGTRPVIIAPRSLMKVLRDALPAQPAEGWIWEPAPRSTAAAVALAAFAAAARDPATPVLIVPADHHVAPLSAYRAALRAMLSRARTSEAILTLGLAPTHPATGYGYLQIGERLTPQDRIAIHRVERFVEKPPLAKARTMAGDGRHLWNGGTFAFRAEVFLAALARHLPEVHDPLAAVHARGVPSARRLAAAYAEVTSISVDHGVMEKVDLVETVAAPIEWDDLGSWDAVARQRRPDPDGNRLRGEVTTVEARECVVDSDGGHVALLGVEDLIVVRAGDAVLVARRGRGEDVRRIVEQLKAAGREDLL